MTSYTASFQAALTAPIGVAATRDTTASFALPTVFGSQVVANQNALTLTTNTPASLTLVVDTPGNLGS